MGKPYNTRKPRRGKFNAFPPEIPRWGRHRRRWKFNGVRKYSRVPTRIDPWLKASYDSNYTTLPGEHHNRHPSWTELLLTCIVLPKSRNGQVACTTIHGKLSEAGKLQGNKPRKRQKTDDPVQEQEFEERKMKALAAKREEEREAEESARLLAESLLRPLTSEEAEKVKDAIHGGGPGDEVLARHDNDSVTRESMRTLQPRTWVVDEVINYYLKNCLAARDEALCNEQPGRKRSHS